MKNKSKKTKEPEPVKPEKEDKKSDKRMADLVKDVEKTNPEFVEYLRGKGLVKK